MFPNNNQVSLGAFEGDLGSGLFAWYRCYGLRGGFSLEDTPQYEARWGDFFLGHFDIRNAWGWMGGVPINKSISTSKQMRNWRASGKTPSEEMGHDGSHIAVPPKNNVAFGDHIPGTHICTMAKQWRTKSHQSQFRDPRITNLNSGILTAFAAQPAASHDKLPLKLEGCAKQGRLQD